DDAFLGQPLDLARGASEQFGQHVHIVLAVARRAAVYRAADIGRGLRHFHRYFIDRPGADLRAGDFGQSFEMTVLRFVIPAVLARAAISAVRRRRFIGRTVAVAAEHALIGRPVEYRRAGEKDAALALRGVDPLSLAGALAVIDRTEQGQRVTIGAHPVEIGIAPAHRHR